MDREHNAEDDEERDKVRQRRSRVCNVEGEEDPLEPQSGYFRSCSENTAKARMLRSRESVQGERVNFTQISNRETASSARICPLEVVVGRETHSAKHAFWRQYYLKHVLLVYVP